MYKKKTVHRVLKKKTIREFVEYRIKNSERRKGGEEEKAKYVILSCINSYMYFLFGANFFTEEVSRENNMETIGTCSKINKLKLL